MVLRALGLGDFLTGIPALRAVRRAYPAHRVVLVAPGAYAAWVRRLRLADAVRPADGIAAVPALPDLATPAPEAAVDLHGRGPGSQPMLLALRPARLIAFAHPAVPATRGLPEWRPGEHEVSRWCRLLEESGISADPTDLDVPPPPVEPPASSRGATLIHPGAASGARRWPVERFAAVARAARADGPVVVTGSPGEVGTARFVAELAGLDDGAVLAGRTPDLDSLAAVVAAADRVVCGDTGVAHLATALGTSSVVIMGPVPPSEWGPPPGRRRHVALWGGEPGERGNPHGAAPDPRLLRIGVDDVVAALGRLPVPAR